MDADRKRRSDKEGNRKEITRTAIFNLSYVIELCTSHCTCSTFGTKQAHLPFPLLRKGCSLSCERLLQRQVGQRDDKNACRIPRFPGRDMPLTPLSLPTETKCGKNVTNAGRGEKECRGRGQRKHLSLLAASIHSVRIEIRWDEQISFLRRHQRCLFIFHDWTGAGAARAGSGHE